MNSESELSPDRPVGKVTALLSALPVSKKILILPHDNPDLDARASAFALQALIKQQLKKTGLIGLGGIIGRSENRALVSLLGLPLTPYENFCRSPSTPATRTLPPSSVSQRGLFVIGVVNMLLCPEQRTV